MRLQHAGYCQQYSGKHVLRVILCRGGKSPLRSWILGFWSILLRKYSSVTFLLFSKLLSFVFNLKVSYEKGYFAEFIGDKLERETSNTKTINMNSH